MNKIRIGRSLSGSARLAGNLPAMIRRVQQNVSQNIFGRAAPGFAFAVLVGDAFRELLRRKASQIFVPQARNFSNLRFTLIGGKLRPHRKALRLLSDTLQPQALGGENVGE